MDRERDPAVDREFPYGPVRTEYGGVVLAAPLGFVIRVGKALRGEPEPVAGHAERPMLSQTGEASHLTVDSNVHGRWRSSRKRRILRSQRPVEHPRPGRCAQYGARRGARPHIEVRP